MTIAIGSDHAGVSIKQEITAYLKERGLDFTDMGPFGPESVDYPDYGERVAGLVAGGKAGRGILICGTGIGMSIVANKFAGIRAALCSEPLSARLSRQHNDANILVLGGRMIGPVMAREIVEIWLETPFEGGRHKLRLDKIFNIEGKKSKDAHQQA